MVSVRNAKDRFLQSLRRCRDVESFLAVFYERFMESDEAIRDKFCFTDMDRQRRMLVASLEASAAAIEGSPEGLEQLRLLSASHDRFHHDVRPEWYPLWLDALVETAAETDPEWSAETEEAWRRTLGHVTRHMASRYDG